MVLSDKMANDFEEEFVADVSEGDEDKVINTAIVPLKLAYGIEAKDQTEETPIALNLGPIIASNKASSAAKAARLIPHFRLVNNFCIAYKGGFFSESAMKFFQISKSQKKYIPKSYPELEILISH